MATEPEKVRTTVLDGSMVRCRGCGRDLGVTCVAFPRDYTPEPLPPFPFLADDCPVCALLQRYAYAFQTCDREHVRPTETARGRLP